MLQRLPVLPVVIVDRGLCREYKIETLRDFICGSAENIQHISIEIQSQETSWTLIILHGQRI